MHHFELSPNCSLASRAAALLYLSILAVVLPVAIGCAAAGFWPVLVFAGIELAAFGIALQLSLRRRRMREFIRIDAKEVTVGRAGCGRESEIRFPRPWTRVLLQPAAIASWPSRLVVASMGRSIEVGSFLTESERRRLVARLAELIPAPRIATE